MNERRFSKLGIGAVVVASSTAVVLFVPPIRNWVFSHKIWPFKLPWDITPEQVRELEAVAQPGDVVVERNLHSWHWMLFCWASTGSTWVHAAIVDQRKKLINMFITVQEQDFSTYLEKQSTRVVLLRPPYRDEASKQRALRYARSKLGTQFDPYFNDRAGSCVGLIGASLEEGGVPVQRRRAFGFLKYVDGAVNLFNIPGIKKIWDSRDG